MKTLVMILRHALLKHQERSMLRQGAVLEVCPDCKNEAAVYYHSSYACGHCFWCNKKISKSFCSICHKPLPKIGAWTVVKTNNKYCGRDFCENCYFKKVSPTL